MAQQQHDAPCAGSVESLTSWLRVWPRFRMSIQSAVEQQGVGGQGAHNLDGQTQQEFGCGRLGYVPPCWAAHAVCAARCYVRWLYVVSELRLPAHTVNNSCMYGGRLVQCWCVVCSLECCKNMSVALCNQPNWLEQPSVDSRCITPDQPISQPGACQAVEPAAQPARAGNMSH